MWRGLYNSGIKTVIAQSPSAHFHCSVAQVQEIKQPTVISKHVLNAFMQMMTHEKTWSVVLSPHVPKYTQLFDNKADFINTNLNSGDRFSLSPVRSRDFHVNFIFTVQAWELSDSQGAGEWSLFLWCGRGQSFSLLLTNGLDRDKEGIPHRIPYLSFLFASTSLGKILLFPLWGWKCVWTSGSFPSRPQRPVCHFTITRRNAVCYPCWPNCLHISVAFPDDMWNRKHVLSNLYTSQLTVFHINLMNSM